MQRAAVPRATCATPRLPQPLRVLSRAAAPPRACVAPASRLSPHGLRGALRSCVPATEPPPARRRALVPSPRSASRPASSWSVRASVEGSAGAPAGPRIKVWVKSEDVPDAEYVEVVDVDPQQTVSSFKAKLNVDPSLVTLRLVACGSRKPSAAEEAAAAVLDDPRLTLAAAGVTDGSSMLADAVQLARQRAERDAEAARQRDKRRALNLTVSFPDGRASETWQPGDQAMLAALLRGGSLAPIAEPSKRISNFKVLDSGAYTFVPPEAAMDVPKLHNLTLKFDLMGEGANVPQTFDSITAAHLDDILRVNESNGLVETPDTVAGLPFKVKREFAGLRSGATYWLAPRSGETLRSQVKKHEAHNANLATGLEHEASECLERFMRENGHPEAQRYCTKVNVPDGNGDPREVDGVVLADNCAMVLEVKNSLNEDSASQLERLLDIICSLKDRPDCPPELKIFAGKQVRGALAGRVIKPADTGISSEDLRDQWKKMGYTVLLPSGDGLGWNSRCHFTVA